MARVKTKKSTEGMATTGTAIAKVSTDVFTALPFWKKLTGIEQDTVVQEGQKLSDALLGYGASRMAVGEHLTNLQAVLEPHNLFGKFLKTFHFSERTAYRYIGGYKNAKAILPEQILQKAMSLGYNIVGDTAERPLGVYTEAVKKLPPPSNPDAVQAETWLKQVDEVRRKTKSEAAPTGVVVSHTPSDPDTLLKECYRVVHSRFVKLGGNSKKKQKWVQALIGMILADLGVSGQQTFAPTAVPADFRAVRGRPRNAVEAAAPQAAAPAPQAATA